MNLKYLEFQRLMKELQFIESDYVYQSEILKQTDQMFLQSVKNLLEQYPDLKNLWDEKNNKRIQLKIQNIEQQDFTEIESTKVEPNFDTKKIYRQIVKSTHPDKIKNNKLNELYIEATQAYENNDLITLYKVCSDLMIDFEWKDDEIHQIKQRIDDYKNKIDFLESTFTFKWLKSSDNEKNQIILKYIWESLNNV